MWRVYSLLALMTLIAGLTPIAARMATAELPPLTIAFVRFATAGALLTLTARALRLRYRFGREQWPALLLLGTLCVPINQAGFLIGVQRANASHAGIAYALVPVLVYWTAVGLRRTPISAGMIAASTLAFLGAGAAVISTGAAAAASGAIARGARLDTGTLFGDGLLLTAAMSWALFTVLSQPVVRRCGPIQTLSTVFLIGAALHVPLLAVDYLWLDLGSFQPNAVTWRGLCGFIYITLITAYTNYLLWYFVIARYDVARSSVVVNASFLITVLVEAAFFRQALSWWVAPGSALLFAGILLAAYVREPAPLPAAAPADGPPAGGT